MDQKISCGKLQKVGRSLRERIQEQKSQKSP